MEKQHIYKAVVKWTGNQGTGTAQYRGYERTWDLASPGKPVMACSNDPLLGGDASRYNPEDLLLAAVSSCHMLWYLHLCSNAGVTVESYVDKPEAMGEMEPSGKGRFVSATLKPEIVISSGDIQTAQTIHDEIHKYCFIARSVSFPITIEPDIIFEE